MKIPNGMLKYALKCFWHGWIDPGDRVSLVLTESKSNGEKKSGVLLRNMLVLDVENFSLSLAVTAEQALSLANAEKRGEITITFYE
jgi:hypothetical protein